MKKSKFIGLLLIIFALSIYLGRIIKYEFNNYKYQEQVIKKADNSKSYYVILNIPKINLTRELYKIDDERNDYNINIEVHEYSTFPNNIILFAHSGTGNNAYFKDLYKLNVNDEINLYYDGYLYNYQIINIKDVLKTGEAYLTKYDYDTITLITCTKNDSKHQTIYYGKFINKKII